VPSTLRGSYLILRNKNSPAAQNESRSSAEQNKLRFKSLAGDDAALMERKHQFQAAERHDAGKLKLPASSDASEFYHTDHDRKQKLLSPIRAASQHSTFHDPATKTIRRSFSQPSASAASPRKSARGVNPVLDRTARSSNACKGNRIIGEANVKKAAALAKDLDRIRQERFGWNMRREQARNGKFPKPIHWI
jgi:hypothetical protein